MERIRKSISAAVLVAACFAGSAAFAQSANLQRALDHLQSARNALEDNSRKDQHSKQALDSVEQAIEHVRKGLDEARKREQKDSRKDERSLEQEQKKTKK
jgi:hypothetical protein